MTVFSYPYPASDGAQLAAGGGFNSLKQQVHPVDYEAEASQMLVEAAHRGDTKAAMECLADPAVDVNFAGAVCFKGRKAEVVLREEAADEVKIEYEEFRTDVSALFLASHAGNLPLLKKLLVYNNSLFNSHDPRSHFCDFFSVEFCRNLWKIL